MWKHRPIKLLQAMWVIWPAVVLGVLMCATPSMALEPPGSCTPGTFTVGSAISLSLAGPTAAIDAGQEAVFTAYASDTDYCYINQTWPTDTVDRFTWYVDGVVYTAGENLYQITLTFNTGGNHTVRVVANDHPYYADDTAVENEVTVSVLSYDYTYDNNGNRATMTDSRGTTIYEYDVLNRLIKVTEPDGVWIAYTYDLNDHRTSMTVHLNAQTEHLTLYEYNDRNLLWRMTDPSGGVTTYLYNNNMTPQKLTYPNGAYVEYTYNARSSVTRMDHKKSDGTLIASFVYEYGNGNPPGKNGMPTAMIEDILKPDGTRIQARVDYEYDGAYRLVREHRTGSQPYDIFYTYDSAGNRLSKQIVGGATTNYAYNGSNKMISPGTFAYDDKGNMLSRNIGGVTTSYEYDHRDRMTSITGGGVDVDLSYSTVGRLVNASGTRILDDPSAPAAQTVLYELDSAGAIVASYVQSGMYLVSVTSGGSTRFVHCDVLGSVKLVTDANQNVVGAQTFDSFGNQIVAYGALTAPYGYIGDVGYRAIANTGLSLLTRRMYSADLGRFVSVDPIHAGRNWYAYASNRPTYMIDPYGTIGLPGVGAGMGLGCLAGSGWGLLQGVLSWLGGGDSGCNIACGTAAGCLGGAITGGVIGLFPSTLGACIGGALGSLAGNFAEDWCNDTFCNECPENHDRTCDFIQAAVAGAAGCAGGALGDSDILTGLENFLITLISEMTGSVIHDGCDIVRN